MNRTFKLSAVAAILAAALTGQAFAQDSVTIYGVIDAGARFVNHQPTSTATAANPDSGNNLSVISGGLRTSRLGFKGTESLGDGLKAVFQLEAGLNISNGSEDNANGILFNRVSHIGLTDGKMTLFLGREYNEGYLALLDTDTFGLYATPINPNIAIGSLNETTTFGNELAGQSDIRTNNAIRYDGVYGAWKAGLQYSTGGVNGDTSAKSSYGIRLSYNFGSLLVNGSASRFNDAAEDHLDAFTVGAKWSYTDALALAATYTDSSVQGGLTDGYTRRVGSVGFTYAPRTVTYGLAYYNTNATKIGGVAGVDGRQDKLVGLASLALSKRTSLYSTVDYSVNHDALIPVTTNQGNIFGLTLGMNHSF